MSLYNIFQNTFALNCNGYTPGDGDNRQRLPPTPVPPVPEGVQGVQLLLHGREQNTVPQLVARCQPSAHPPAVGTLVRLLLFYTLEN